MKNFIKLITLLVLGLVVSCATFREGNVGYQMITPKETSAKKIVSFVVSGQVKINMDEPVPQNANALGSWANIVKEEFVSSALFSEVKNNDKSADLFVDINVQNNASLNLGLSMVTGLTLYLFPSSATDEFVVEATFKNKAGKEVGKIIKRDSVTTWNHLTMIFLFPFKPLAKQVTQCQRDLINSILVDANSNGLIK